ncbi:MAG: Flp pilus assembly complex ATPase component TadA [Pseudomonadales bacterium]|nr:Flp pilus assembly complex ATPase component TadA [Pseudomonadales bacterium]
MFEFNVATLKGKPIQNLRVNDTSFTIGKSKDNLIVLQGWKVSKNHAEVDVVEGELYLSDIGGKVSVNGKKIERYGPVNEQDEVVIGDYRITVKNHNAANQDTSASAPSSSPQPSQLEGDAGNKQRNSSAIQQDQAKEDEKLFWKKRTHLGVFKIMDLRRTDVSKMEDDELRKFTKKTIEEVIADFPDVPKHIDKQGLANEVLTEAVGLGPLESLLDREDVSEVMVNAHDEIFYEAGGKLVKSSVNFTDDESVLKAIERIVAPLGRRIDESSPMVDARLKDGSRVNAVIPPLALKGPSITIRKFMKERLTAKHLVGFGSVNQNMVTFLEEAVNRKLNVIISGGTGSGKTTLLNVLSNFIPDDERIVTVEDAAELKLYQSNLVSLETRPANQEGTGEIPIRQLVKNCLRMRPDRIVVGECRGGEALDMLQAMNTGHDGSLTTIHSNSPRDCISRLEVLVLMSGMDLPVQAIREQISSAVHLIVQQTRFSCGTRKVTSVCEVSGIESGVVQLAEIFKFQQNGYDENGKIQGDFVATGIIPEFYEDLRKRGIETDISIFQTDFTHE